MTWWQIIATDYRRYRAAGAGHALGVILFTQGLWASAVYRASHRLDQRWARSWIRPWVRAVVVTAHKCVEVVTGISLPPELEAGEGLYIGHFGGVILSPEARLGRCCNLSHQVTIGVGGRNEQRGAPRLGDRVYVGPGALIFGKIDIGEDAAIGAGAVVTKSVPARAVVAGNPAKIISFEGSFEFVRYDGMEQDAERQESLRQRQAGNTSAEGSSGQ